MRKNGYIADSYLFKLFTTKGVRNMDNVLSRLRQCITEDINRTFQVPFWKEEILVSLKSMDPTKVMENDGLSTIFFQRY